MLSFIWFILAIFRFRYVSLGFFSLRSLSFRLWFPVFRFEAKQAKNSFFASKRKNLLNFRIVSLQPKTNGAPYLQQFRTKNPRNGNNFFGGNVTFLKFKYENVHNMKNKPDPALLRTSYLSIEIKKRITKSHETIPLTRWPILYSEM
jgi:hypothetical protein